MPPSAKTAIVEFIVFTGEQSHERESSGELLAPSVLADGAGRTKSYTRAAEKLGISKSAISQKISELERVTGKTLVHRTTRSVSLSDDGLRLVAELNEPFGQLRDIFTGACDEGGPLRGTLRLTAPVAFSRQQLVPAIAPFLHQHPQLHLQLEVTDRLVSLASEGFDLAIRHCRREALPDTHVAWPLCHTATLTVASADYIRRHGRPETPKICATTNA